MIATLKINGIEASHCYRNWSSEDARYVHCFYTIIKGTCFIPLGQVSVSYLGCYREQYYSPLFYHVYLDYRYKIDWAKLPDMSHVIQACAQEAVKKKYSYFAIKNYGQCSWGPHGLSISSRRKQVSWCFYGLGGPWLVSVYKIENPTGKLAFSKFLSTLLPIDDITITNETYQIAAKV